MLCNKASESLILVGTIAITHTKLKSNDFYQFCKDIEKTAKLA